MEKTIGRLAFVGFMWLYSIYYYIECLGFSDATEKMTVLTVFWLFTLFVILELISLIKTFVASPDKQTVFNKKIFSNIYTDYRFHLVCSLAMYLLLMPYLGFYLSSLIAFCAFSYILGSRGVFRMVVPGVIILVFIYIIFTVSLNIVLPQGMIF